MKIARRRPPEPHIPFIALADIAWQIIIFFLVASTFAKTDALKIDVPASTEAASAETESKTITVAATPTGILLDGKPVDISRLKDELIEMLKNRKSEQERAVLIEAHQDLTFQRDAEIMYAVQQAGGVLVMSDAEPSAGSN